MTSEAQKRANKKWDNAHKDRLRYLNKRSAAKQFILKDATAEDLERLFYYISKRRAELYVDD